MASARSVPSHSAEKTGYPLAFPLYEKEAETKIVLAQAIDIELKDAIGVSVEEYQLDILPALKREDSSGGGSESLRRSNLRLFGLK